MLEWIETLTPILVAVIPTLIAIIKTAHDTREHNSAEIKALSKQLGAHINEYEEFLQKERRVRILRAADDIASDIHMSSEHWSDVIEDIDEYEEYCETHPQYHNNKGLLAIEYLKNEFMKRKGVIHYGETVEKPHMVVGGWHPSTEDGRTDCNRHNRHIGRPVRGAVAHRTLDSSVGGSSEPADQSGGSAGSN